MHPYMTFHPTPNVRVVRSYHEYNKIWSVFCMQYIETCFYGTIVYTGCNSNINDVIMTSSQWYWTNLLSLHGTHT